MALLYYSRVPVRARKACPVSSRWGSLCQIHTEHPRLTLGKTSLNRSHILVINWHFSFYNNFKLERRKLKIPSWSCKLLFCRTAICPFSTKIVVGIKKRPWLLCFILFYLKFHDQFLLSLAHRDLLLKLH